MLSYCEGNGMPGGYQQTLPAEPQQHFHGAAAYPGSQSYEGWPGMALKQIMGQIDLLNFQNSYYNNSAKWPAGIMNNSHGYFAGQTACHDAGSGAVQQPKQSFKANCGQMESDNSSAWLGPQVWSRRIGSIDMSNDGSNQDSEPEPMQENSAPIKTEAPLPELDFLSWFSMDKKASIEAPSGNASPINPDDDFSAADLALASVPGLSFDPKSRCFTPEELKPQPIIRKRRKVYVCDAEKNEEYWAKRVKNNVAARRSREARRIKENQIALRAAFLERENTSLRNQVEALNGQNLEIKRDVEQLRLKLQTLSTDTDDNNKCSTPES